MCDRAAVVTHQSASTGATVPAGRFGSAGGGTRYRLVEAAGLTAAEIDRWLELRASNPLLDSPYFHPRFTAAVAANRPGVAVVVGEDLDGTVSSFLPVQFEGRACRPAGSPAADFQGPICAPGTVYHIQEAMSACGFSSYEFDHLLDGVPGLEPWVFGREPSPYIDVSGGIEGYMSRAGATGKEKIREARRLRRRAERDHGPLGFSASSSDAGLLDALIACKRRQYAATGARDFFADARHVRLMHRLLGEPGVEFSGMLSAIYVGPSLLAAHFGLRAGPVLHWWFPAYEPEFSRLSPGWLLLAAVIDAAPDLGVERIDLGRGIDAYKRWAMTGREVVCQGAVIRNPVRRGTAAARRAALAAVKTSWVAPAIRGAVHYGRRRRVP